MNWDEAVTYARTCLEDLAGLPSEVDKLFPFVKECILNGSSQDIMRLHRDSEEWPEVFDALVRYAAECLGEGSLVTAPFDVWISEVLLEKRQRPLTPSDRRRGYPDQHIERDLIVYLAVQKVGSAGKFKTDKNPESASISAIGVVAEALQLMGESMSSYDGVRKAYRRTHRQFEKGQEPAIAAALPMWVFSKEH